MNEELLKKAKQKKRRAVIIVIVIAVLAALGFTGLFPGMGSGTGTEIDEVSQSPPSGSAAAGTVFLEIDCSDLSSQMDRLENASIESYIPEDGILLDETSYAFTEGETVYDCLYEVCRRENIQMESSEDSVYKSRYVEGIGHLYEMDAGKRSGWTYEVEGKRPDVGCSKYPLHDGDHIKWIYVVDYTESETDSD